MSFVAVAIGGSAVIGAGVSIASGNKAANASRDAAATNNALQRDIYGQNKATLSPFVNAGNTATNSIQALLGMGGGFDANQYLQANPDVAQGFAGQSQFATPQEYARFHYDTYGRNEGRAVPDGASAQRAAFDQFRASTGYDFRKEEGNKALTAALGRSGSLDSGAAVKSAMRFNQNLASDEFGRFFGAMQGQQALGVGAASAQAGVGQNFANATSANNNNAAAGIGSAALNTGNAVNSALGNAVGAFSYTQGLKSSYNPATDPTRIILNGGQTPPYFPGGR